jgi:hypothetical protein
MSFFSKLQRHPAANPANPYLIGPADSQHSQDSQGGLKRKSDSLDRLKTQAGDRWPLIRDLDHGAVELLDAMPDGGLRAYAVAASWSVLMAQGIRPPEFTVTGDCNRCGPVYLPPGADAGAACCWCAHRRAGVKPPTAGGTDA